MTDTPESSGRRVSHLGHVHLKVRTLANAVDFYTDVFDLAVVETIDRFAFLSWGEHHHDVALQALGENTSGPSSGIGLYHVAFEVTAGSDLRAVYERLIQRDVAVSPVDHGISKALYFSDPSGNGLEVYLDTRESMGTVEWQGRNRPFDPLTLE